MWKAGSGRCAMKFEQFLGGMVKLKLPAACTEMLLQQLSEAGVHLYQIRREAEVLTFRIALDDFYLVQHLLRERRCPFHVEQRQGLPFLIHRMKRRKGLWLGCLFALATVYLLLSLIWGYEVNGNEQYSDAHMIALVQQYGMLPGARRDNFDYDALERQMVQDHPEFTWIQLQPNGTTLTITVKERLPEQIEQQKQGSLVASADGRITEMLVFRGTPLVKRGDWVKKGQVLVGGWDYTDRQRNANGAFEPAGEPFAVKAQAVIYGEQERREIGICALHEQVLQTTGQQQKQVILAWGGHVLRLWGPQESPYTYYCQETTERSLLQWQQFRLPVFLKTTVFIEKEVRENTYTEEEAYVLAVERARKRLQLQMPTGSRFMRESTGVYRPEQQNVVQAEVVWVVETNMTAGAQTKLPQAQMGGQDGEIQQEQATGTQ